MPRRKKRSPLLPPPYRIIGMGWQLNLLQKEIDKIPVTHKRETTAKKDSLVTYPLDQSGIIKVVNIVTQNKLFAGVSISRIDFILSDDYKNYMVYSTAIQEECVKYAIDHGMLEEKFITSTDTKIEGMLISVDLMKLAGYEY